MARCLDHLTEPKLNVEGEGASECAYCAYLLGKREADQVAVLLLEACYPHLLAAAPGSLDAFALAGKLRTYLKKEKGCSTN